MEICDREERVTEESVCIEQEQPSDKEKSMRKSENEQVQHMQRVRKK